MTDISQEVLPTASQERPALAVELNDVRFHWPGGFGLRLDHWSVAQGDRIFLHGPSGSGKSTLLSLLSATVEPQSGNIRVNGTEITSAPKSQRDRLRAETMGVIFQMFNLIPYLSALDNILLPLRFAPERRKRAGEARARAVELGTRLGLDPALLADRPAHELSIGQQQRVAVARALIGRPSLVIADEPTSALDRSAQERFIELLFEEVEAAGSTLVFVSHDQTLSRAFDRTVALSDIAALDEAP